MIWLRFLWLAWKHRHDPRPVPDENRYDRYSGDL